MFKYILFLVLFFLLSCKSRINKVELFYQHIQEQSGDSFLNLSDKYLVFKEPGCVSCNVELKKYLDTVSYIPNVNLVYLVKYPDNKYLNLWKTKFGERFILDRTDVLNHLNSDIMRSGSIIIKDKKLIFQAFLPSEKNVISFIEELEK